MDTILTPLKSCLLDQHDIITIQYVMERFHVDSTNSKKLLFQLYNQYKAVITSTFVITGIKDHQMCISLVIDTDLDKTKSLYSVISSIHLYSIQTQSSSVSKDILFTCIQDETMKQFDNTQGLYRNILINPQIEIKEVIMHAAVTKTIDLNVSKPNVSVTSSNSIQKNHSFKNYFNGSDGKNPCNDLSQTPIEQVSSSKNTNIFNTLNKKNKKTSLLSSTQKSVTQKISSDNEDEDMCKDSDSDLFANDMDDKDIEMKEEEDRIKQNVQNTTVSEELNNNSSNSTKSTSKGTKKNTSNYVGSIDPFASSTVPLSASASMGKRYRVMKQYKDYSGTSYEEYVWISEDEYLKSQAQDIHYTVIEESNPDSSNSTPLTSEKTLPGNNSNSSSTLSPSKNENVHTLVSSPSKQKPTVANKSKEKSKIHSGKQMSISNFFSKK